MSTRSLVIVLAAVVLAGALAYVFMPHSALPDLQIASSNGLRITGVDSTEIPTSTLQATSTDPTVSPSEDPGISVPVSDARSRVTKKPFGIYITPKTSPVRPERFTGYHTGADLETTPAEADIDVPVHAICDGELLVKRTASGYGGVAVESCTINGQAMTVVYGHLRLSSITPKVGEPLMHGEKFAVLGKGYSSETDGERKHLHLAIHKGTAVNILGYVQRKADLAQWIDPLTVLP